MLQSKRFGFILLKPDGNQENIVRYALKRLLEEDCTPVHVVRDVKFWHGDAFTFYPKDESWRMKYGAKLLAFWKANAMDIPVGYDENESHDSFLVRIGDLILRWMAYYLSDAPCVCILFETEGDPSVLARKIVGESPIPEECSRDSLRGKYNPTETLVVSYSQYRALYNVAHSPENVIEMEREGRILVDVLRRAEDRGNLDARLVSRHLRFFPDERES